MLAKNEVAAIIMEELVTHDSNGGHGYSQGANRWGNGVMESIVIDGKTYQFAGGDRDCSSGVISVYEAAGIDCGGATYTGNMVERLVASGNFVKKPPSFIAATGDSYLNIRDHVAMCKSQVPDLLMQFSIDENGNIIGGQEGDQTGWESNIQAFYDYPWDCIMHYVGEGGAPAPDAPNTVGSGIPDLRYQVYTQKNKWLPEMVNHFDPSGSGDTYAGDGTPILYIAMSMPGWYQARTKASGWLPAVRGYSRTDFDYGCAGDGSPITGFRAYYETQNPAATGMLAIEYSVANVGGNFMGNIIDNRADRYGDTFAGNGGEISALRAKLIYA